MGSFFQKLLRRFNALHPAHVRIARSAAWVAGFVLVGKLAAAARDMAVAWRYGVSEAVDSYQLATSLVFWLPSAFVSVLSIVLVPLLVRLRQHAAGERELFLREMQGSVVIVGISLGLVSMLLGIALVPYLAGKLSANTQEMARQFTIWMAPTAVLVLLIGVYSARLMARERQINTLLEGVPAAAVLLSVLLWPLEENVAPLLWGTVLGITIQAGWLSMLARRADGQVSALRFSLCSPHWVGLYKVAALMAVSQFVMSFITPLDQFTAAQLGEGAVATLGYANRAIGLLLSLGAVAFARAALPVMADLHATGQGSQARSISVRWAALMLGLGALVAVAAWLLAPWGISLLFERGAFSSHDTANVTEVFRWGLVQVPFYFAGLVFVQLLAVQGRYNVIGFFAVTNLVVKLALNLSLPSWLGVSGIALATGLMYAWSAGCLSWSALRTRI